MQYVKQRQKSHISHQREVQRSMLKVRWLFASERTRQDESEGRKEVQLKNASVLHGDRRDMGRERKKKQRRGKKSLRRSCRGVV